MVRDVEGCEQFSLGSWNTPWAKKNTHGPAASSASVKLSAGKLFQNCSATVLESAALFAQAQACAGA